jgi:methylated-DNA-[protein]-cysteine S-methyltransferase
MLQNNYAVKVKQGWVVFSYSDKGVTAFSFPAKKKSVVSAGRTTPFVNKLEKEIKMYFGGKKQSFSCPFDFSGFTEFQKQVWRATKQIPEGETRSYSFIAKKIGKPLSARAVGKALGKNPCPIIIPCHRVIKNDGTLGGFSGRKGWKEILLEMERSK